MSGDKEAKNTDDEAHVVKPEATKMSAVEVTLCSGTMHVLGKTLHQGI